MSHADRYILSRATSPEGPWEVVYEGDTSQFNDTNDPVNPHLLPATRYYYRVAASNTHGESAFSPTVTVLTAALDSPQGVTAIVSGNGDVVISWTEVSNADSYVIEYSPSPTADGFDRIDTVLSASAAEPALLSPTLHAGASIKTTSRLVGARLLPGVKYYYLVRAAKNGVLSAASTIVNAVVPLAADAIVASDQRAVDVGSDEKYENVATLHVWTGSGWAGISPSPELWNKETVILTHGWNSDINTPYMAEFAQNASNQDTNILAIDWANADYDPSLGSNPNGLPLWQDVGRSTLDPKQAIIRSLL